MMCFLNTAMTSGTLFWKVVQSVFIVFLGFETKEQVDLLVLVALVSLLA